MSSREFRFVALGAVASVGLGLVEMGQPVRAADAPFAAGIAKYRGIHPVWPQTGGFCYIDVPHVHNKSPTDLRAYRTLPGDENLFIGDPVALGYDGPKFAYFGPHPFAHFGSPGEKLYCYLRGPHFHARPPDAGPSFVSKAGVSWFVGSFPIEFARDRFYAWVNDSPVLASYQPPKVSIADAPDGYHLPDGVQVPAVAVPVAAAAPPSAKKPALAGPTRGSRPQTAPKKGAQ